jgi:hypothetical protein
LDFGPTLAAEALLERHGVKVSRETLRKWMVKDGLWLSRKQRRSFHQPRLRRECLGELVQTDGSEHRWFEQRGEPCTLLVFIDDATSKLMQLRFVPSESTDSYFEALDGYLKTHGCPVAFYSDKHTVLRVNKPDAEGGSGMIERGLTLMISRGLVTRHATQDGFSYQAEDDAGPFLDALDADYLTELKDRATWVVDRFHEMTDQDIRLLLTRVYDQW